MHKFTAATGRHVSFNNINKNKFCFYPKDTKINTCDQKKKLVNIRKIKVKTNLQIK